jgi:hypothetical protein
MFKYFFLVCGDREVIFYKKKIISEYLRPTYECIKTVTCQRMFFSGSTKQRLFP